eukprot:2330936-Pyramimonas_sp.AAC.3
MAVRVAHDNVAVPIDHDSGGAVELSGDAFTVAMSLPTVARQCGHQALGPDPASVDTRPCGEILRMRWLNVSHTMILSSPFTVTPHGWLN